MSDSPPLRDNFDASGLVLTQCAYCRHERPDGSCPAFPRGIPDIIVRNVADHRWPFPGDRGIRFEARPDATPEMLERLYRTLEGAGYGVTFEPPDTEAPDS